MPECMQSTDIEKAPVRTYDSVGITSFELSCVATVHSADATRKIEEEKALYCVDIIQCFILLRLHNNASFCVTPISMRKKNNKINPVRWKC